MTLKDFFIAHPEAAVAFSGGVDSAYLLYEASRYARRIMAYFVHTAFQPAFELADARRAAGELGVPMRVLEVDILSNETVRLNPPDRCYHCKRAIFSNILSAAAEDGFSVLLDGSNASDDASDRPGMRALEEMNVLSPLRLCGYTKDEIRARSKAAGLFTHDKPAYACLATRVPTGRTIDGEILSKVEGAEAALNELGYSDLRVRALDGAAKLQLTPSQMERALSGRGEILKALSPFFTDVLLDLKGR